MPGMKELPINTQLAAVREGTVRGVGLRQIVQNREETPKERLLRDIFEPVTAVARSEKFVDPEELTILKVRVEDVRDFLFKNGKNFTQHPSYGELNKVLRTPEDEEQHKSSYWYVIGEFQADLEECSAIINDVPGVDSGGVFTLYTAPVEVSADTIPPEPENLQMGALVRMRIQDGKHSIYFKIGFDETYTLQINFFDSEDWDRRLAHYVHPSELEYKADLPLANMTQEEATIIQHYLDLLLKQAQ